MNVGKNIAALRKSANLTQEQLAEKCNVSRQAVTKWETGESEPSIERLIMLSNCFGVTIDEMIKGDTTKKEVESFYKNITMEELYNRIEVVLFQVSFWDRNGVRDLDEDEQHKLNILWNLYHLIKNKFVDKRGKVYSRYLIGNTTSEERKEYVSRMRGMGKYEYDFLVNDYISGKNEINEVLDAIINDLDKRFEVLNKIDREKMNNEILNQYVQLQNAVLDLQEWDDYSEQKQREIEERVNKVISEIEGQTLVGRFMEIWGQEILDAYANKDMDKAIELENDLEVFEIFVRSKIPVETEKISHSCD